MTGVLLTALSSLNISTHHIPSHGCIPNTATHNHPLLIYHSVFPPATSPSAIEAHLPKNNVSPQWRYTMYSTTHYHSTTHEVLCVWKGRAKLLFGGEQNPGKVEAEVVAGDAIVIPAGVGHRLLDDYGSGFQMVGSYPKGCSWDMCYGNAGEAAKAEAVKDVKWFEKDPLYGEEGRALWKSDAESEL